MGLSEPLPLDPGNGDQSDIGMQASITDVRKKSDLSDYTGGLRPRSSFRITDQDNGTGDERSATVQDLSFAFTIPCSTTASGTVGSTCSIGTTYESIYPGTVKELKRAIWALDQIQVFDGGADGNAATSADNTLFAVQGVFIP